MPNLTLAEIQEQVGAWSRYNFPRNTPLEPMLGIIEEVGELAHAILKTNQGIRGTAEEHVAEERDAIGDAGIFLCDFAGRIGHSLFIGVHPEHGHRGCEDSSIAFMFLSWSVGHLAFEFTNCGVPDGYYYCAKGANQVALRLAIYCETRGWDFLEILNETWSEASKRDWIRFPKNGLTE